MQSMKRFGSPRPSRAGLSLMEVLVSVFVLMIGLLGVMAALPIGGYSIHKAKIADRSAACGRAALAEVRVRNMTDLPNLLWDSSLTPIASDQACVVDPLFTEENAGSTTVDPKHFPYEVDGVTLMPRGTLLIGGLTPPDPSRLAVARRIFTWQDQVTYSAANEDQSRPQVEYLDDAGQTLPALNTTLGTPLLENTKPEFTWMTTVSPKTFDSSGNVTSYEVTVVVFYKRDYAPVADPTDPFNAEDPITERAVDCELIGGGWGGGDVLLSIPSGATRRGMELDLKDVDYIMLYGPTGFTDGDGDGVLDYTDNNGNNNFDFGVDAPTESITTTAAQWYKVVGSDEIDVSGATPRRLVSLVGPDWRHDLDRDSVGPSTVDGCQAVIATGVVGVYTTTIPTDEPLNW